MRRPPPDVLVVDVFPRGLAGELAPLLGSLRCHKILVHRDLNPEYVERYDLSQFVDAYNLILVPGEEAPFQTAPHAAITAPWLMRDADELLSPAEARRALQVESNYLPVVAVMGCGRIEEVAQMRQLANELMCDVGGQAEVRFVTPAAQSEEAGEVWSVAVCAGNPRRGPRGRWRRLQYGARGAGHWNSPTGMQPTAPLRPTASPLVRR